jgi:low affinity Fe/Cu permease
MTSAEYEAFCSPTFEFTENMINSAAFPAFLFGGGIAWLIFLIVWGASGRFDTANDLWIMSITAGVLVGVAFLVISRIAMMVINFILNRIHEASHARSPIGDRIRRYEEARSIYREELEKREVRRLTEERIRLEEEKKRESKRLDEERIRMEQEKRSQKKLADYWMGLGGIEFEIELGRLYQQLGYDVETTPGTGDKGVDLILRKNGLTTVVQCKRHTAPVGPAIARDMYGAMVSFGADDAILACTSGFTPGVLEFVKGKRISLVSAKEIVALVESATSSSS